MAKTNPFNTKKIIQPCSKEYFEISKILEKNLKENDMVFVSNFIEEIALSNQECISIIESISKVIKPKIIK